MNGKQNAELSSEMTKQHLNDYKFLTQNIHTHWGRFFIGNNFYFFFGPITAMIATTGTLSPRFYAHWLQSLLQWLPLDVSDWVEPALCGNYRTPLNWAQPMTRTANRRGASYSDLHWMGTQQVAELMDMGKGEEEEGVVCRSRVWMTWDQYVPQMIANAGSMTLGC